MRLEPHHAPFLFAVFLVVKKFNLKKIHRASITLDLVQLLAADLIFANQPGCKLGGTNLGSEEV